MCSEKYLIPYIAEVKKRNGFNEEYDQGKIEKVLKSLFKTTNDINNNKNNDNVDKQCILIGNMVTLKLSEQFPGNTVIPTSVIQEVLEKVLMELGYYKTLKLFIMLGYAKEIFSRNS